MPQDILVLLNFTGNHEYVCKLSNQRFSFNLHSSLDGRRSSLKLFLSMPPESSCKLLNVPSQNNYLHAMNSSSSIRHATTGLRHRNDTFPSKLYEILSNPEYSHIISWLPHGKSWKVHNNKDFEMKVMPKYFVMTKWSSFARQVNGWGFSRILIAGMDRDSYHNQLFIRDRPDLVKFVRRRTQSSVIQAANTTVVPSPTQYCLLNENVMLAQMPIPPHDITAKTDLSYGHQYTNVGTRRSSNFSSDMARILNDSSTPSFQSGSPSSDIYEPASRGPLENKILDSNLSLEPITVKEDSSFENVCSDISNKMSDFYSCPLLDNFDYEILIDAHKRKRFPFGQY